MLSDDFYPDPSGGSGPVMGLWQALAPFGTNAVLAGIAIAVAILLVVLAILVVASSLRRRADRRRRADADRAFQDRLDRANHALESQLTELKGRLAAMSDIGAARQSELSAALEQRLDRISRELGQNLAETRSELGKGLSETSRRLADSLLQSSERTGDQLSRLGERLAVIDTAQANLTELSNRVVSLQDVLADKQARGAFGQVRMEAIIQDGLPRSAYTFQATLSNGRRPDCLIHLPNATAGIVVDAKFPLEGFEALRTARTSEDLVPAKRLVREPVARHIADIA